MNLWKELMQLKIRILHKFLPSDFDHLEHFLIPTNYTPLNSDRQSIDTRNKTYKTVQETKRTWLDIYFNAYYTQIQTYDQQYQRQFKQLELEIRRNTTIIESNSALLNKIKDYLNEQQINLKQTVNQQIPFYRKKLLKDRQHLLSMGKSMIGVSPEPYLDLLTNPCDKHQWHYLTLGKITIVQIEFLSSCHYLLGPSFIRLNQSATRPQEQQQSEIKQLHKDIFDKIQAYLMAPPYPIPRNNPLFKQFSERLLTYLKQSYSTPQPYKDQLQAQHQARIFSSILKLVQSKQLILRQTDKGNNFYLGAATDYEEKVQKFFTETDAFQELSSNPFKENLQEVCDLLDRLLKDKEINGKQFTEMKPDQDKTELAHLYFNPKTHKV